ncbi:MAG: AAA family ATPase [Oscillibacter sp.]|nr:AAA family ATPase [Oscillibacter sp.]
MRDLINATEAERAVLGAILIDGKCLRPVAQKIREDDFSTQTNREIYRTMLALDADGKYIDGMLVGAAMRRSDPGDDKALRGYLAQIMELTPTSANVMEYVEIVLEKAKRRRLREALTHALEQIDTGEKDDTILPDLEAALADNSRRSGGDLLSPKEQVDGFFAHRQRIDDGEKPYVRTGIKPLDRLLAGGLQEGGLYFMAARPGMGKTALALYIAEYVASTIGTVIFISMEMTKAQITARRIAHISLVNSKLILTEELTPKEYADVADATIQIGKTPMYITDGAAYSAARITAIARSRKDVRMVVVDHFSLISVPGRQRNDIEYAQAAHALKNLAKTLNCPVLCLAQLNRENEQRGNKRPRLSDLRETGAAEQDADGVLLLHRPDYYDEDKDATKGGPSLMEVHVAKNRHGDTGKVELSYYKATNIFREMFVK